MIKVKPDAHTTIFIGADSGIRTRTVQILSLLPPTYCAMSACANLIPIGRSHDCLPCILGLQASLCSWLWLIDRAPHYLPGQTRRIVSNSWVYSTTCGHTILSHSAPSMLDPAGLKTAVYPLTWCNLQESNLFQRLHIWSRLLVSNQALVLFRHTLPPG